MRSRFPLLLAPALLLVAVPTVEAQVVISLGSVIGVAGTNAATVSGVGNAVNFTGYGLNSGATSLVAGGSSGSSSFDFNSGFSDSFDRATGSTAGAPNVWADMKYDSSSTSPLILDTNSNGLFTDETALTGFGMHSDTFITFDLAVIRASAGLGGSTAFTLSGAAGIANTSLSPTSGAIVFDSTQLAVFDWNGPTATYSTFSLFVPGSARYLTFAGLSGLDSDNFFAHVGFANVQLLSVPEPSIPLLLSVGLGVLGIPTIRRALRGRRCRGLQK